MSSSRLLAEPDALAAYVSHVKDCRVALRAEHEAMLVGLIALASGARRELTVAQRDLLLKEVKGEGLPPSLLDEVLKSRAIAIVAARKSEAGRAGQAPAPGPGPRRGRLRRDSELAEGPVEGFALRVARPPELHASASVDLSGSIAVRALVEECFPRTTTSTAWEKTLQASLTYLKDAESKAKYDRSLFNVAHPEARLTDRPRSRRIDVRDRRDDQPGPDGGPGIRLFGGDRRAMHGGTDGLQQGQCWSKGPSRRSGSGADPVSPLRGMEWLEAGQVPGVRLVAPSQVRKPHLCRRLDAG